MFTLTDYPYPDHSPTTVSSHPHHEFFADVGGSNYYGQKQVRWETMDKDGISFATLTKHYLITCATEGNTPATLRGYKEKLNRIVRWSEGATLPDFGGPLIREYIG